MTVPLSDAVARSCWPEEVDEAGERARKESGDLCARMTLATVSVVVEKRRTSPDWEIPDEEDALAEGDDAEGVDVEGGMAPGVPPD